MNITRRFFIGGAASFGALAGCRVISGPFAKLGAPRLTFGVISDTHVRSAFKPGDPVISPDYNNLSLIHAFEWFRDQGADGVVIAGDMADRGRADEFAAIAAAWYRVFPNDRAPDGRKVEKLFIYGNHDMFVRKYGKEAADMWEQTFNDPFDPIWTKTVRGYRFVGAHWWNPLGCRPAGNRFNPGLGDWYAANAKKIDPSLPFFHIQHPHPKDTCYGPWAWGRDDGFSTKALSAFPNAVAFSGHSHYSLTDERSIWQGAFTSVGTSTLRYAAIAEEEYPETGFENSNSIGQNHRAVDAGKMTPEMPLRADGNCRQGMLWKVYDDCMTVRRHEFITDLDVGENWTIPLPCAESKPFAFAERAKKIGAPEFPSGAALEVSRTAGKTRGKKESKKANRPEIASVEKPAVKIVIPAAIAKDGARAYQFEIAVSAKGGAKVVRRIIAEGYEQGVDNPKAKKPTVCMLALDALPKGTLDVAVAPLNCYGRRGAVLRAKA